MISAPSLKTLLLSNLDFVTFRLPQHKSASVFYHPAHKTKKINASDLGKEEGFVIAPFEANGQYTLISPEQSGDLSEDKAQKKHTKLPYQLTKDEYLELARNYISTFQKGALHKAILSRVALIEYNPLDIDLFFEVLQKAYPNAFVYCLRTATNGIWMGATPEKFMLVENGFLSSVALAGTQPYTATTEAYDWQGKEIQEQAFVTDYIKALFEVNKIDFQLNGSYTAKAGPVVHLKTDISSTQQVEKEKLAAFAQALHPTPAVCGLPKQKAFDFIVQQEPHNRDLYAGFLGPIESDSIRLFVNLRCMQVFPNHLALFLGGGLTKDSVAEQEWQETVDKSKTLLSVLEQAQKMNS